MGICKIGGGNKMTKRQFVIVLILFIMVCAGVLLPGCKEIETEGVNTLYCEVDMQNRFDTINEIGVPNSERGWSTLVKIIVDKETGVLYLWHNEGDAGGLTVMVDAEGKPLLYEDFTSVRSDRGTGE